VQIYQAALAGADAVLLIVASLSDDELKRFKAAADQIGMDCLVEVHDETELGRALEAGADFIGINNRNLATFEIDLKVTEQLAPQLPDGCTIVSESGIRTAEDLRRVMAAGAHAVLIGEALMRAADPRALLEGFRAIAQRAK
jgi:indole-3-glycerol phosphate synthase